MKKILALVLACLMLVGMMTACASSGDNNGTQSAQSTQPAQSTPKKISNPNKIADEMTSSDGKYEIAFVTDVGQLLDKSFNQGTWNGVKVYAYNAGKSYKYYMPSGGDEATDDDRYNAMKLAAENGATAIVCAGFMQGTALEKAAKEFPNVKFIFIDGWSLGLDNVTGISFQEEQCGYLAGYAAVMEGYTKLGFCGGGGGANAACNRYGYGFVQGADAAAKQKGVNVEINYSWLYGANFQASAELQTMAANWYSNGTEVIFACGGSMFASISAAASAEDGKVIGVDVDQSFESPTVITSAMKGIDKAAQQALEAAESDDTWAAWGQSKILGAKDNAVGLPTATWSLKGWSQGQYSRLFNNIVAGSVTIDNADVPEPASTANVTVNIVK